MNRDVRIGTSGPYLSVSLGEGILGLLLFACMATANVLIIPSRLVTLSVSFLGGGYVMRGVGEKRREPRADEEGGRDQVCICLVYIHRTILL